MGKPYLKELNQLASTYEVAIKMDNAELVRAISASMHMPLLTVGSGGSLTAALLVATLHQRIAKHMASAMTPLELIDSGTLARRSAVVCLSAGGGNSDIRAALQSAIRNRAKRLVVACARVNSPLASAARKYDYIDVMDFALPCGHDGFLATNSLLAFSLLFARAYHEAFACEDALPEDFSALMEFLNSSRDLLEYMGALCEHLWKREYLIVLHGPDLKAAAVDLESKFAEAALGPVLAADYRNFAHGPHHWLAKRGDHSAVLAFTTESDQQLAQKTLALLPTGIPVARFHFPGSMTAASLAALVTALHVVALAGLARSIDPGRPGVPEFGRRIYNLRLPLREDLKMNQSRRRTAVRRKIDLVGDAQASADRVSFWLKAYDTFTRRLAGARFSGLVVDYDGTLCCERNRYGDLDSDTVNELVRLLQAGVGIGVATGRGKPARAALQRALPREYWGRVVVGYYNGGDCALLADSNRPDGSARRVLSWPPLLNHCQSMCPPLGNGLFR